MRVAYVSEAVPYPPTIGAQQRRFHLLRAYAEAGCQVTLFSFSRGPQEESAATHLRSFCEEIVLIPFESTRGAELAQRPRWRRALGAFGTTAPWTIERYRSGAMRNALARYRSRCDVVHLSRLTCVPHLGLLEDWRKAGVTTVLDVDDVESTVKQRSLDAGVVVGPKARLLTHIEQYRLRAFEARMLPLFDVGLVCSEIDRDRLSLENLTVIPNGIEAPGIPSDAGRGDGRTLLFVGFMDYAPNADAVRFFVRRILPLVRREIGEARLVVVGRTSDPEVLRLHDGVAVDVVGEVQDLGPYYRTASVVVVPLRVGGGTRIKILEAFAWRRPVVSTTTGVEGIPAVPNEDMFVEDLPEAFAARCVSLLKDPILRASMAGRAQRLADAYEWAGIRPRLVETVLRVRRGSQATAAPRAGQESPR